MAKKLTKKEAEALWAELSAGLVAADVAFEKVIRARAWEPFGMTFSEAYDKFVGGASHGRNLLRWRSSLVLLGIELGREFDWDAEAIAKFTGGSLSAPQVEQIKKHHQAGVPATMINPGPKAGKVVEVQSYARKPPGARETLHLDFTSDEIAMFKAVAKAREEDYREIASGAVRNRFKRLETQIKKDNA